MMRPEIQSLLIFLSCIFGEDTSSASGHGGSDQPQTSLRLACRGRSWENEALGIRPRDATANHLIADSVDHGIRQQYPPGL